MIKSRLITLLLLIAFSISYSATAQNHKFGLFANYGLNFHSADFNRLKDIPNCCPNFESGSGSGIGLGFLYEYNLESRFSLGARLGYSDLSGELSSIETTTLMIDNKTGDGEFEHLMEGNFSAIEITPMLIYRATDNLNLYAGLQFNLITTSTFDQIEKIKTPADRGTFIDENGDDTHSRTRNEYSGDIPEAKSNSLALSIGVGYELPLNSRNTLRLAPEMFYKYGLSELVTETSWKVSRMEVGIALKYVPTKGLRKEEIFKEIRKVDTLKTGQGQMLATYRQGKEVITTEREETETEIINYQYITRTDTAFFETKIEKDYKLETSVSIAGLDDEGNKTEKPEFIIEEFVSRKVNPLLTYIFFEENSAILTSKYVKLEKKNTKDFNINDLFEGDILDIYYNILNIIGDRMLQHPQAKITLTGCNSDLGVESNNQMLSQRRAETIRDYLLQVWGIDKSRIRIEVRNLPVLASLPKDETDKSEENRRVEISSDTPEIVDFVSLNNIERKVNPPKALIALNVKSDLELADWNLMATQENSDKQLIKQGVNNPPSEIEWAFSSIQNATKDMRSILNVSFVVSDVKGNKGSASASITPISILTIDKKASEGIDDYTIDEYRLILFDFNSSNISGENKAIVDLIKSNVKPDSEIRVTGHTDRTGDDNYNKKLSQNRADNVSHSIGHKNISAVGMGEDNLLLDNNTPEARFYCRTVIVEVKTKK